jgi:hypothetical protein
MKKTKCGLSWCQKPIPPGRHGNAGGCCPEHSAIIKAEKEKARYEAIAAIARQVRLIEQNLRSMANIHGEGVFISTASLKKDLINYGVSTGSFIKDGFNGVQVGCYGYMPFKNNTIKIYKLC